MLARRRVPRPAGLSSESVPSSAARRSSSPRRPEPSGRVGAADAVVGDLDGEAAVGRASVTVACVARAYFATLASASETTKYAALSTAAGRRSSPAPRPSRARARAHERLQRRLETTLGQHHRMDAARELAQLGEARAQLFLGGVEQRLPAPRPRPRACARSAAAARAPRAATAPRRAGRARAAAGRRRRPRRAGRATPAAPPCAPRSSASRCETWLRSSPPRNANGIRPVATNAAHQATSPAPARATVTSRKSPSAHT